MNNKIPIFIIAIFFVSFVIMATFLDSNLYVKHSNSTIVGRIPSQTGKSICLYVKGGLGNTMFRTAAMYVLALQTNRFPRICSRNPLDKLFGNLAMITSDCDSNNCLDSKTEIDVSHISIKYVPGLAERIKEFNNTDVRINGMFRNLRYTSGYMDSILAQFTIRKKYKEAAQKYLHFLSEEISKRDGKTLTKNKVGQIHIGGIQPVYIAVHVRRGDLLDAEYMHVPESSYFEKAMNLFRQRYGEKVIFIVLSNGLKWCKENIKGKDVYFSGENGMMSTEEDFSIGVSCNHTVMSVGTFGWWVGYLSGGDVVYFKDWTRKRFKKHYIQSEVYPDHWIPMGE